MPVIGQGVEICTSTTRPTNPVVGTVIYETDTASYRWCTAVSPSITWLGMTPSGTVQSFAGSTSPTGWLLCDGASLNATANPQYADLYAAIGTTYGGSGISAFNLPNLSNRFIRGNATPGTISGADSAAHTHGYRMDASYDTGSGEQILSSGSHFGTNWYSTTSLGTGQGFQAWRNMMLRQDNTFSTTVNTVPVHITMRYIIKV